MFFFIMTIYKSHGDVELIALADMTNISLFLIVFKKQTGKCLYVQNVVARIFGSTSANWYENNSDLSHL